MFVACLECFQVVYQRPPLEDQGVIPIICSMCRDRLVAQEGAPREDGEGTDGYPEAP